MCATATVKVTNDITTAPNMKMSCAAIFIDLAKAFDTVHHSILFSRLENISDCNQSLAWVVNYLSGRVQCVKSENVLSQPFFVAKGVPQGSTPVCI